MAQRPVAASKLAGSIAIRDERAPTTPPQSQTARIRSRKPRDSAALKPIGQAMMDYQMGFTSGPSN